jgi:hypothetical protein
MTQRNGARIAVQVANMAQQSRPLESGTEKFEAPCPRNYAGSVAIEARGEGVRGVFLCPVTLLIFFPTSAGAGIIATNLVVTAMDGLNRGRLFPAIERELRLRA